MGLHHGFGILSHIPLPPLEGSRPRMFLLASVLKFLFKCRTRLPAPKSLLDIANFGVENEAHATQACYEIMEQLKKQITFNLLVVVGKAPLSRFPLGGNISLHLISY